MKDKRKRIGLILQAVWVLIFAAAALLLEGKYRTMAILCACACVYTLIHSLIRGRAERKLAEGAALAGEEEKTLSGDREKL